jgi:hypothetical protein
MKMLSMTRGVVEVTAIRDVVHKLVDMTFIAHYFS